MKKFRAEQRGVPAPARRVRGGRVRRLGQARRACGEALCEGARKEARKGARRDPVVKPRDEAKPCVPTADCSETRAERIVRVRTAIANGTYRVSAELLAQKLVEEECRRQGSPISNDVAAW